MKLGSGDNKIEHALVSSLYFVNVGHDNNAKQRI